MTTTRPSLDRKDTRKTKERRNEELDQGLRITLDGEVYEVRVGDVTPEIARGVRQHHGVSFMRLMDQLVQDPDVDAIAAFVWTARRLRGEAVDFEDVTVTYAQLLSDGFDVDVPGAPSEDADPEA